MYFFKFSSFLILISGINLTYAQKETNKIPELNGHVFMPYSALRSPFTNTYLDILVGIGSTGQFKYPIFEVQGNPIYAVRGELLFATVGLRYQQKIQDWVSLYIENVLATRLGTNIGSILAEGFSTVNTFKIGWKIRIIEHDRYWLSASAGITNYKGSFISISQFVEDVVNNNPYPSLVTNIPALNANLGFHFSYGLSELFGLQIELQNSIGESLERGETAYFFAYQTALDVNFYQKHSVPIALSLNYLLSSEPEQVFRESGLANRFNFKIAYTGTNDFILGLTNSYSFIPVSDIEGNFNIYGATFSLTYYFN